MNKCYIVGISGGTCSGKTALASELHKSFAGDSVYISQDSYYKDQSHQSEDGIKNHNFDHPSSLDLDLLHQHVLELKNNNHIEVPDYCFKTHSRTQLNHRVEPATIIIVEGILIFSHLRLKNSFDLRVFVDIEPDIRLIRRINRDVVERGRTLDSIIDQYLLTVKPMHDEYVENQKIDAELVIENGDLSDQSNILRSYVVKNSKLHTINEP